MKHLMKSVVVAVMMSLFVLPFFAGAQNPPQKEGDVPQKKEQAAEKTKPAEEQSPPAEAGEPVESPTGIVMIPIPAGSFNMGDINDVNRSNTEKPVHLVNVDGFLLGQCEITQAQYEAVMGENPSNFNDDPNKPVEKLTWLMAVEFCNALSEAEGLEPCYTTLGEDQYECDFSKNGYRLPTEAEWEYACRAGTTTIWNTGNEEEDCLEAGWVEDNSSWKTQPVMQKTPNNWGLYDMHGNVAEFCNDRWDDGYYAISPTDNPRGSEDGLTRCSRGGGCLGDVWDARCARRDDVTTVYKRFDIGFRVARYE